jgi:hypothetical protein
MENVVEKKQMQSVKETSKHKIVRSGRNNAKNLSTYRELKRKVVKPRYIEVRGTAEITSYNRSSI